MSISRRLLLLSSICAAVAVAAITIVAFSMFYQSARSEYLSKLADRAAMATAEHGEFFRFAREVQLHANALLEERIGHWETAKGIDATFEDLFPAQPDGTRRSADKLFDGYLSDEGVYTFGIGAFISPKAKLDREGRIRLLAALDVVRQFGATLTVKFDNFYYYTPDDILLIFAPKREDRLIYYRRSAPAEFTFQESGFAKHVTLAENAARAMQCTGLENIAYDKSGKRLTTGCQTPFDLDGAHVGAFGISLLLDGWLKHAIATGPDEPAAFIIETDGEMIAHEDLLDRGGGEAYARRFSKDLGADNLLEYIRDGASQKGTVYYPDWNAFVAYSKFSGPDWFYVTKVPASNVTNAALIASSRIAVTGVVALGIALFLLSVMIKRVVRNPLKALAFRALNSIDADEDAAVELSKRKDEVGQLAAAFQSRDARYRELLTTLDERVRHRTTALELSRKAAESANEAKTAFLANMSHEIRSPMNGVLGMVQVLARTDLNNKQRSYLDIVQRSGENLLEILNSILDLSKIEAGKLELEQIPFDLRATMKAAASPFEIKAAEKNLTLSIDDANIQKNEVVGDPVRLTQIVTNLLSNAIKFTTNGGIEFVVNTEEISDGDCRLSIICRDTGIGMSSDVISQVFEPFTQSDVSTTRKYGGTGLGLAICKQLVEQMGGSISVKSVLGEGSEFTVDVRLKSAGADTLCSRSDNNDQIELSTSGENAILVAEDQELNRIVIRELLADETRELEFVHDGEAAIEHWRRKNYDVILMDIQMPKLDGVSAAKQIRALETELGRAKTPIIALTANVMEHQLEEYRTAQFDGIVAKPIDKDVLVKEIARAFPRAA